MRWALPLLVAGCGSSHVEAAPSDHAPTLTLQAVDKAALCLTKGALTDNTITEPTMRGYARGAGGDAAQLTFTYRGESTETRELASGQVRRQIGLKLRAQDGCNVVYVMWRLDPKPKIDVSVKYNPGKASHSECGADGYTKVKPIKKSFIPQYEFGKTHTLRAEIVGDDLFAWIDGKLLFQGRLPDSARLLKGPAGIRSDNVQLDINELAAPTHDGALPACKREAGD